MTGASLTLPEIAEKPPLLAATNHICAFTLHTFRWSALPTAICDYLSVL
jgi:hypothetical protein